MNPSRAFILRPVATSLLMVAVLLAGVVALPAAAGLGAAGGRLPDDPGRDVLPGRQPRRDGVVGDRAARAAVRPDAGAAADDVDELRRAARSITLQFALELEHRRRRAGGAGSRSTAPARSCRADLPTPPIYSKVNPADAPILTLALTSETLPLSTVEDLADTRLAPKISQLPGVGLVTHQRRPEAGRPHSGEPDARSRRYGLNLEDVRTAVAATNVNQAKGSFDGPRAELSDRRQRSAALERRLRAGGRRLSGTARRSA